MALYYRYKSERFFDSIAINVPFISVSYFKQRIFESKRYGWGNDFDLVVINAHNNEGLSWYLEIYEFFSLISNKIRNLGGERIVIFAIRVLGYESIVIFAIRVLGYESIVIFAIRVLGDENIVIFTNRVLGVEWIVIFAIRVLGGDRTVICSQLIFIWIFF
jgi:hypothetical protein